MYNLTEIGTQLYCEMWDIHRLQVVSGSKLLLFYMKLLTHDINLQLENTTNSVLAKCRQGVDIDVLRAY